MGLRSTSAMIMVKRANSSPCCRLAKELGNGSRSRFSFLYFSLTFLEKTILLMGMTPFTVNNKAVKPRSKAGNRKFCPCSFLSTYQTLREKPGKSRFLPQHSKNI